MNFDPFSSFGPSLGDLLRTRRRIGGFARAPKPSGPPPEEEALGPETAAVEEEAPKAKAILKNPNWEVEKVGFNEETDISVEAVLPEAEAHKTKVAFELFAKTPEGEERISQAEGHIAEGKAVARIPVYIPQYKDEEGSLLKEVEYYFSAKHSASDLLKDDTVVKRVNEMANLLIECHILEDVTFATAKSQVRAAQAPKLKALTERIARWKEEHPEGKIAIFGHADAVGREEDNKKLSERRAKSIHAFLVKDSSAWDALAKEEKWDKKAIPDFQAFMDENNALTLPDKAFEAIDGKPFMGCSEFNQVDAKKGAHEPNRRVSVLLLKSSRNFPIQYPCAHGDIAPCQKQVSRKGDRRTAGFGCLFYDRLVTEGAGACGPKGTVKLAGITEAEIKQYVNMDPEEGKPEQGMDRKIEVEVDGLGDGDEVFWTVKPGVNNSARTGPKKGPKLLPEDEPVEFKDGVAPIISTVEGGKSHILLACGNCGGDEFTVEVGGARDKVDSKVKIVTWRRLEYETIHPKAKGPDRMSDYSFKADKGPGIADQTQAYLDKVLATAFVEFKEVHKDCYLLEDLPENGKWNVLDGKLVRKERGKKVTVATTDQMSNALVFHGKHSANKRSVSIMWCDFMGEIQAWQQKFTHLSTVDFLRPNLRVFEHAIDGGAGFSHGDYCISSVKWAVSHWHDGTDWKPVSRPEDPGYAWRNGGTITDQAELKEHFRIDDWATVACLWPDTKAHYPGKKVPRNRDYKFEDKGRILGLSLQIQGAGLNTRFEGMAWRGKIWMHTKCLSIDNIGVGVVLAHELGHNMGQGYADKSVDARRGRNNPIPGIPFPKGVPEGNKYGERGHRGIHCATGVTNKAAPDYNDNASNAFADHKCLMFGATDINDSKEWPYCDECLTFIKAEVLTDIRKEWAGT